MKPPKPPHIPNDDLLADFIAELIVAGDRPETQGSYRMSAHQTQVRQANQEPLNQAAAKFLPPEWQDDANLHVLSLMRWGIDETKIRYQALSPGEPTHDEMDFMIAHLGNRAPKKVMRYLETAGGELGDDETQITPEEILAAESPREAAKMLLDALRSCLSATRP